MTSYRRDYSAYKNKLPSTVKLQVVFPLFPLYTHHTLHMARYLDMNVGVRGNISTLHLFYYTILTPPTATLFYKTKIAPHNETRF